MTRSAALVFSGGKDSTLAWLRASRMGYKVSTLVFMETTLPFPNPHYLNFHILRRITAGLGPPLLTVRLRKGLEKETLAEALQDLDVEFLIAGDVFIEDHIKWYQDVARIAGLKLLEPLYGDDTQRLYWEIVREGIEFTIIAVSKELPSSLLGTRVSMENANWFSRLLSSYGCDPIGENGEYHTIVNRAPWMKTEPLEYRVSRVLEVGDYASYAILT